MMMPVVGHPTDGMPGAVEHGPEDEPLLDPPVYLQRAVRQQAVVTDRCAEATEARQ
jgi:hypothetical protein